MERLILDEEIKQLFNQMKKRKNDQLEFDAVNLNSLIKLHRPNKFWVIIMM